MFCRNCGKEFEDGTKFCPMCGTGVETEAQTPRTAQWHSGEQSHKSRTVTALLAFFLGYLGVHRFYVGKTGTGILQMLLTCCFGIGAIWALIDLIVILCGNFTDSDGKRITDWNATY